MEVVIESIERKGETLFSDGSIMGFETYGFLIKATVRFKSAEVEGSFYFPGEQEMSFSKAEKKIRELFVKEGGTNDEIW
ncbi:hypothetical protein [Bacillus glycinifermentans]|uniref:Uncharacterized protein n=1 Tax=Bacillus glycinifermentans TaxID=1664069 RepID=A0A0T6BMQ1_9BACI|nr:hypothetical protein [Bacillus glycinifermentans]ATH91744.1 hypothetical protein COP00_03220 [Bacillus glycinifermentans]AUS92884.1 hypothetical protein [Bacillus glycinifermentans]KRT92919.1 hypothetical protein AB447_221250 [Bacillus glycinifermentans]MEC0488098.1 hypothetical protein [Bacillus glycinifermentans]